MCHWRHHQSSRPLLAICALMHQLVMPADIALTCYVCCRCRHVYMCRDIEVMELVDSTEVEQVQQQAHH